MKLIAEGGKAFILVLVLGMLVLWASPPADGATAYLNSNHFNQIADDKINLMVAQQMYYSHLPTATWQAIPYRYKRYVMRAQTWQTSKNLLDVEAWVRNRINTTDEHNRFDSIGRHWSFADLVLDTGNPLLVEYNNGDYGLAVATSHDKRVNGGVEPDPYTTPKQLLMHYAENTTRVDSLNSDLFYYENTPEWVAFNPKDIAHMHALSTHPVPEPATWGMLALGFIGFGLFSRLRSKMR